MTPQDKQDAFYKELKELLVKYNAELTLEDVSRNQYFSDTEIVVEFNYDESLYEENGTGCIPYLKLGKYEDGK
jgi:hypothetical protein